MLKHSDIWRAIDRLAKKHGMSPSGLARRSGLDPTTFNKSKRVTKDGKQRWPSTESISKILIATGDSLAEFVAQMGEYDVTVLAQRIPVIAYAEASNSGYFDNAGRPQGTGWDEVLFPQTVDLHAFGLEISGGDLEPLYRDGDIVIVSPAAGIRRGDRVVVRSKTGEIMAKELARQSARRIELISLNRTRPDRGLEMDEIDWMARIVWASQ